MDTREAPLAEVPDTDLLGRFVAARDEEAFAQLVQRHGAMVHGVCNRVLADRSDADDAFQATFMALAAKAGRVRRWSNVAGWLYRVAVRAALECRRANVRWRRSAEMRDVSSNGAVNPAEDELRANIDEALRGVPERYRVAVVLCDQEGHTPTEAARLLALPVGTVSSRLTRGRGMLRDRLVRRGLHVTTASLALSLAGLCRGSELTSAVVRDTTHVATSFASAGAKGVAASTQAAMLAKRVLQFSGKSKLALGAVLVTLAASALLATTQFVGEGRPMAPAQPAASTAPAQPPAGTAPARSSAFGFVEHFDGTSGLTWQVVEGDGQATVIDGRLRVLSRRLPDPARFLEDFIYVQPVNASGQPFLMENGTFQATVRVHGIAQLGLSVRNSLHIGAIDSLDAIGIFRGYDTELTGTGEGSVPFSVQNEPFVFKFEFHGHNLRLSASSLADPSRQISLDAVDAVGTSSGDICLWIRPFGTELPIVEFDDVIVNVVDP